jgi:WD40 repeat protein
LLLFLFVFQVFGKKVDALAVSPINDSFLSGSVDGSVRLWDLRINACQGVLKRRAAGRAGVAFDPQVEREGHAVHSLCCAHLCFAGSYFRDHFSASDQAV